MIITSLFLIALTSYVSIQKIYGNIEDNLKSHILALDIIAEISQDMTQAHAEFTGYYYSKSKDNLCLEHLDRIRALLNGPKVSASEELADFRDTMNKYERQCRTLFYAYEATYFDDPSRDYAQEALVEMKEILNCSKTETENYYRTQKTAIDNEIASLLSDLNRSRWIMYSSLFAGISFLLGVVILTNRALNDQLGQIVFAADSIREGDISCRINSPFRDVFGKLAISIDAMADRIQMTEEELKNTNRTLMESLREAEKANVAKSEFLANMSHEIRTPMNSIIGFTEILKEDEITDEQERYLSTIHVSAKSLLQIINDILDISKIEAGKFEIEYEECSLEEILNYTSSLLSPLANRKQINFKVHRFQPLPEYLITDGLRVRQCLINLINNAIKFTEQGHVYLNVSTRLHEGKDYLCFEVEDSGIGIEKDEMDIIFDAFSQADGSSTRKYGGTGLGLTITQRLVELLGGTLSVESEIGRGSTFTVMIPLEADSVLKTVLSTKNISV